MAILEIERNYRLVEKKMIEQMEEAFEDGRKLIDSELDTGIFDFIIKPVVKTFYKYWSDHDSLISFLIVDTSPNKKILY